MSTGTRAGRRLHLLVVEATSGATVLVGVLTCSVALLLALALSTPEMLPGWADPLNLCLTSSMIFAPIACGSGAVVAGRLKVAGLLPLAATAPHGRWRVLTHAALAMGAWLGIAFLLFSGIVLVSADRSGPLSAAMWLLPAQALLLIATCVTIGVAVGARVTWFLTGPVLSAGVYALLFRLDISGSRVSPVYTDIYYQVWLEPNARLLTAVSLVLLATAAAVVGFAFYPAGRALPIAAAVVAATCLMAAGAGFHLAGPGDTQLRAAVPGTCGTRDAIELCVWSDDRPRLAPALQALADVEQVSNGTIPLTRNYYEEGLVPQARGARPFQMPGHLSSGGYVNAAAHAAVPAGCDPASDEAHMQLWALINELLRPDSTVPELGARDVARRPLVERRDWAGQRLRILGRCP